MDAEHRHELKTNELAEGLHNIPTFLKDNANTIIGVTLICIGLITWPMFNKISKQKDLAEQIEMTQSIQMLEQDVFNVLRAQQAKDASDSEALNSLLLDAESLLEEADDVDNPNLKAMAQIKAAQAYRTELHLRRDADQETVEEQIGKAQAAYEAAAGTAETQTLKAMAQFGLALCSEELGQFAQASQIYNDILAEENFKPTTVYKLAQQRLEALDDNSETFSFTETAKPIAPIQMPENMSFTELTEITADNIEDSSTPIVTEEAKDATKKTIQTNVPTQ